MKSAVRRTGLAALLALGPASRSIAQQEPPFGYHDHMWEGGWGMIFGPFAMLIFAAAIVIVVVLVIRWLGGPGHGTQGSGHAMPPHRGPLDILKERFARGEIDKSEFEERRRILEQ